MNNHHKTALTYYTRLATECLHPRFRRVLAQRYSVILTCNSGYE
jgi:hypothetical protein